MNLLSLNLVGTRSTASPYFRNEFGKRWNASLPGSGVQSAKFRFGEISPGSLLAALFGLWLWLSVTPIQATELTSRFFAHPGGQVIIQGGQKPYDWEVRGRVIEGTLECAEGFPLKSSQAVKPGKVQADLKGSIPVRSLHSCYGFLLDEFMYSEMNETNAPRILFHFSNWLLTVSKGAPYKFETQAELVLAGITNRISMPVTVTPMAGNKLKISGDTFIKLANLGLQASRSVSLFIKNGDQIRLSFDCFVARKPSPLTRTQTKP
jgi:hypothetical protein